MNKVLPPPESHGDAPRGPQETRGLARGFEAGTKAVVLASLVLAVGIESWLGRVVWRHLPHAVALAAGCGFLGARFAVWPTSALILLCIYLAPVALFALLGRFSVELLLVWSAAIAGLLVGDRDRWRWAYPPRWQFPLVLWALTVALAWPITALREIDFTSLALLQRYNVPNTSIGGSPRLVVTWGLDTAIIHLLGLLWFNWLFARAGALTGPAFRRWIAWPMGISAIAGSLVAGYQGLIDFAFLSVGSWATLRRASGSLLDANASGMAAALWSAGLLALAMPSRNSAARALPGAALCVAALWMTASRTALATLCVSIAAVTWALLRKRAGQRTSVIGGTAAALAIVALALAFRTATEGPLYRLRGTLPTDVSRPALSEFAREMWNRNGYGRVATTLIAERPLTGVGIGLFNLEGSARAIRDGEQMVPRRRVRLPPDNAQNWWRHHVAELGFLGAAGLMLWTLVFLRFLWLTSGQGERRVPAAALKGALVGLGLVSLLGMPAQSLPLAMTFWAFAFWYVRLVRPLPLAPSATLRSRTWLLLVAFVVSYAVLLLVLARGADRPAVRAAFGGWRYTYGVYEPDLPSAGERKVRWTEREAVTVVRNEAPWMVLTVRAEHPDIEQRPVRARVTVNGRRVIDTTLYAAAPLTRAVNTGTANRAIIETSVNRTWRRPDLAPEHPDVGLSLSWTFAADRPAGLPAVTAPLRR